MKYITGLPTPKFADLLIRLREKGVGGYPPSLGLRGSLKAVLIYMRHNIVQAVIGKQLGVSQPTISRAIKVMTGAIVQALKDVLLTAQEVPEGCDCRAGRHTLPLLKLARSPRIVVGQAWDDRHERL
ncbi:transposase family protein [Actinomyces sp. oral taxon 414]|uniref:transposase family protein n=1 Tax=Actinomyces sp. oral taxon 414 TaxID=712122 RepID=UPI000AC5F537|nr:transposase family protein [Actinomyces sp. oral taxon 414]